MATLFRPTTADDEPALISLFSLLSFWPARILRLSSRTSCAGSTGSLARIAPEPRAYVLEREGRLVAHAGLWPVVITGPMAASAACT